MSFNAALGEAGGAIAEGEFMAGEGRRFYGRTTTSAVPNKYAMTVRQPLGVAGLIIAANTPIANGRPPLLKRARGPHSARNVAFAPIPVG